MSETAWRAAIQALKATVGDLPGFLLTRIAEDERRISADRSEHGYGWRRALAECEAKRRIVALHPAGDIFDHMEYLCTCGFADHRLAECACGARLYDAGAVERPYGPCPTLAALALPYADHPDYREEWRP